MPRGGQESWRDKFLRETKGMKGKGGAGKNPFATPVNKVKTKATQKTKVAKKPTKRRSA